MTKQNSQIDWNALTVAIKSRMQERDILQSQVALESGVSKSRISELLKNQESLGAGHYTRICAWLGVPPERFMLNHEGFICEDESTPDKVEAALMRDKAITRKQAVALSSMFRVAYRTLAI